MFKQRSSSEIKRANRVIKMIYAHREHCGCGFWSVWKILAVLGWLLALWAIFVR